MVSNFVLKWDFCVCKCVSASTILFVCVYVCVHFLWLFFLLHHFQVCLITFYLILLFYFSLLHACLLPNKIEQEKVWIREGGEDVEQ